MCRRLIGLWDTGWCLPLRRMGGSATQRTGINETQNANRNIIVNNIVLSNTASQVATVGAQTIVTGANITA